MHAHTQVACHAEYYVAHACMTHVCVHVHTALRVKKDV